MCKQFDERRKDLEPYGLTCELWRPNVMRKPDRHNDIEINYLSTGSITYLIHDQKINIESGKVVVFWALMPHQIVGYDKESPYYVITIPFSFLLQWNMPQKFLQILFSGAVQTVDVFYDPGLMERMFQRWISDLQNGDSDIQEICTLEIQAYLKRFAFKTLSSQQLLQKTAPPPINLVERMAIFIAENFTQPIKVTDVAKDVGLHPDYANVIFKRAFNCTISSYLVQQRVLYAQRKLSITNDKITSIAYEAGFNSISRFNSSFRKYCNYTPRDYRRKYYQGDFKQ